MCVIYSMKHCRRNFGRNVVVRLVFQLWLTCGEMTVDTVTAKATALLPTVNLHHRPTEAWRSIEQLGERNHQQQHQQPFHRYQRRIQDEMRLGPVSSESASLNAALEENAPQEEFLTKFSSTSNQPSSGTRLLNKKRSPHFLISTMVLIHSKI
jgi:hypothetical protein